MGRQASALASIRLHCSHNLVRDHGPRGGAKEARCWQNHWILLLDAYSIKKALACYDVKSLHIKCGRSILSASNFPQIDDYSKGLTTTPIFLVAFSDLIQRIFYNVQNINVTPLQMGT